MLFVCAYIWSICTHMSFVCQSYVLVGHLHITRIYPHLIRMSLVCTRMSLACHAYVTCMYSHVIHVSLVCTRMSSVGHSYLLVCPLYVTRMYSYVIRMSLVCGFSINRNTWKTMYICFIVRCVTKAETL